VPIRVDDFSPQVRRPALRWVFLGMGVLDLIRLVPEVLQFGSPKALYLQVVANDVLIGSVAVAAGIGLSRGAEWGWALGLAAWGAVASNSFLMMFALVILEPGSTRVDALIPRFAFYVASLLVVPYGIWAGFVQRHPSKPSRDSLMSWFVVGLIVSAWGFA
jgi:hypothetical protein